ncbi:transcription-repair coupling factor [Rhodomicrobium lacus]|uniref:transcription-repair coupling factor n=1 Tax=Rhodomicrobium lacus TaxID=2498452 RepID=UPI000F8F54E3|nr:transcription-repair coupling factor [Rhodomicrobium lacus]
MAGETETLDKKAAGKPTALDRLAGGDGAILASGVPEGHDAFLIAAIARRLPTDTAYQQVVLHIARDDHRLAALKSQLEFFAPGADVLSFPAWDCVPYDRVSPDSDIEARRIATLARLAHAKGGKPAIIVLTTVNAALQRVPPLAAMKKSAARLTAGGRISMEQVVARLEGSGFMRTGTVMEPGEYAVRGGILDLYVPGHARPARLDFFGDTLETIRTFDPVTQRTQATRDGVTLLPISEIPSGDAAVKQFRQRYVELFGPSKGDDALYEAVSAGTRYPGVEHWLPLFYDGMDTLFDYLPNAVATLDHLADEAALRRLETIADHYEARREGLEQRSFGAPPYKPLKPDALYLTSEEWTAKLGEHKVRRFEPFPQPDARAVVQIDFRGKQGRSFALERAESSDKLIPAVAEHIRTMQSLGKRAVVACWTNGARERLGNMLSSHVSRIEKVANIAEVRKAEKSAVSFALLGLESGYETPDLAIIAEQDILGDRLIRRRKAKKASDVLVEASSLTPGDLMVHADHGIGRFIGLKTIDAAGAPHDCVELEYAGGDKLFLPIENMELLTRYGSDEGDGQLDKLGGASWQGRKARLKKRIREMAEELIKVAALREMKPAPVLQVSDGAYNEFVTRFPYEETDDQLASIEAVADDLAKGRPMDRLVCGDVGFGKTEVALRAAFIAVMEGKQVAVVVPTTLLARQHYQTFVNRFQGFPVKIAQASRLVTPKEMALTREGLKAGQIDIVVGTHALLAKSIAFKDLGLLIVDEEQHFGVAHKERLKNLREEVHVLTLTATPIPRTLQLALTGVREMSVIATPPVDRLAVRTFITPFDPVTLREALLRERYRGGQCFYVVPRISDLDDVAAFLREHVPEIRFRQAHGQMAPTQLEDIMSAFYDREFDVLLSTTIVESGLDIPNANTLIVHRADMFGLAALYQLRGRVGRSKTRAYAMFTIPPNGKITPQAEKRLKVLHSLDSLGAGFTLASHDLDLRGAGNLLGEEQSGHIKEVGYELYQSMLEEAVAALKANGGEEREEEEQWSPTINVGLPVLLPEAYVPDLQVRLGLYRRLSGLHESADLENFAAELADRFGPPPDEVKHLLTVVQIKNYCRKAGIAQVDAGPKGAVITFRNKKFANPQGLVKFMYEHGAQVKLQIDQKLVYKEEWDDGVERLRGARALVRELAAIAKGEAEGASGVAAGEGKAIHEMRLALPKKPATPPPAKHQQRPGAGAAQFRHAAAGKGVPPKPPSKGGKPRYN